MSTPNTIVACFEDLPAARNAIQALIADGVDAASLGALLADSQQARQMLEQGPGKPAEGGAIGSVVGGTLFGMAAVAMSTTPFGVLAIGPFAALLGGAAVGAGAGGVLGALVGMGIPENESLLRVEEIREGGVLVTCKVDGEEDATARVQWFTDHGARTVFSI